MEQAAAIEKRKRALPVKRCGARTHQSKTPCRKAAGWGTSHQGYGQCKLHGGSTPSGIKSAAAEAARDFAVGMLGAEVDVTPNAAMLLAVRLAAGMVAYYRLQMAAEVEPSAVLVDGYERATERMGKLAKAAIDANVDERLVRIAERTAEQIALAAEDAMRAGDFSPEQRTLFAQRFGASLARLEDEPLEGRVLEA